MGHTESQIVQRTGHKSITSIKSYTTTLGVEGEMQQKHIFSNEDGSKKKQKRESADPSETPFSAAVYKLNGESISALVGTMNAQSVTINYNAGPDPTR